MGGGRGPVVGRWEGQARWGRANKLYLQISPVTQEPPERHRSREKEGRTDKREKKEQKKHVKEVLFLYLRDDRRLPELLDVAFCRKCVLSCYLYWIN